MRAGTVGGLRERYPLTKTEAVVAALIAEARAPREIASLLCVSIFTVRAHLRSIFAKTG